MTYAQCTVHSAQCKPPTRRWDVGGAMRQQRLTVDPTLIGNILGQSNLDGLSLSSAPILFNGGLRSKNINGTDSKN
jgi:hypothetical protein